ncbi:hypothetical protein K502DRAFT_324125 [Neoconidiobolus thromboides FSU 785]|nr:hypothetical protein K502DRAFT_324125 [Neoconidiobolus thromboides FSU 785]
MMGLIWVKKDYGRFILKKEEDKDEITNEEFIKLVKKLAGSTKLEIDQILWKNTFKINECTSETHFKNNVFLCGDAAHTHSPAGGQGMNTGIQDSYNLAWKLSLVLKGVGKERELFNTFNEERSSVADMVIKNSGAAIRNLFSESNMLVSYLKKTLVPFFLSFQFVQNQAVDTLSEIGIEYNENELTKKYSRGWISNSKIPGVGLRVPDNLIIDINSNSTSIHKILNGRDKFEIFVHIPESWLNFKSFNKLVKFIKELKHDEEMNKLQSKMNGGLFQLSFILDQQMFNIKQWGYYIEKEIQGLDQTDLQIVQQSFEKNNTYLDIEKWGIRDFGFSSGIPTFFIVRPDGYISFNQSNASVEKVLSYFKTFIKL